jgi:hypothetical protein
MKKLILPSSFLPFVLLTTVAACSGIQNSMGRLGVRDYTARTGERVMAGQAEPREEYRCRKVGQERRDWGLSGNMDRVGALSRVTAVAVDAAPGKGANYVDVMVPGEASVMGFNVNAFRDAEVAYYQCASLPPAKDKP